MPRVVDMIGRGLAGAMVVVVAAGLCGSCASTEGAREPRDPPQVEKLRLQITKARNAIDETRRAIAKSRAADFLPELYVRLAELLSEEATYHYRLAAEREQRKDQSTTVPQVRLLKQDAIGIYRRVVREFPGNPLAPRALFNIGHEHRELGNFADMRKTLRRLVNDYPDNSLRFDALLVLGDYYFDKQQFGVADNYYDKIVEAHLNRHSGMAHYKRAWVRINRGHCEPALDEFEAAIETSEQWKKRRKKRRQNAQAASPEQSASQKGGAQQDIDVRREALVDLTYCYSRKRSTRRALSYLKDHAYDRASYLAAVSRLASRYRLMDKFDGAVAASRELLSLGSANDVHMDDARTFYSALKQQEDFEHIGADIERITHLLTAHYGRSPIEPHERDRLVSEFEKYVRDLATSAQEALDEDASADRAASVARGYAAYLDAFPDSEHVADMELNLSDVLDQADQPFEAGRRAAQASGQLDDARARRDALYDAVVYCQEALEQVTDPSKYRRVAARATLRRTGGQLLGYDIAADKERRVKFAIAQTFYDEGRYDEAIDRLTAVAYEFPRTDQADAAIQLVLDSYNTLHDYDGLMYAGRRFQGQASPASKSFQGDIDETVAAAEQRKLDELSLSAAGEDGGDLGQLTQFAEQNPGTEVGQRALVNAFVAARAVGDTDQVYSIADKLAASYPNSDKLPGIYNSLAQTATTRFEFDQAIDFLKRAAQINKGQRARILSAAGGLQAQLGRASKAEATYRAAIDASEGPARGTALAGLAKLLEKYRSPAAMVRQLAPYDDNPNADYQARLGLALLATGKSTAAETAFNTALANETSASAGALGRAHYGTAELMRQTVEKYPRPTDLSMVQEFIALVELTQQSYLQAARQASPAVTSAALSRLAVASKEASSKLLSLKLPDKVSDADKVKILQAMKQRAKKLRATGEEAFEACGQQAYESYNFTPVTRKCLQGQKLTQIMIPVDAVKGASTGTPDGFDELRGQLSKNPTDVDRLESLGEKFFDGGHHHAARLVLQKAIEAGGGPKVYNLYGRANEAAGDLTGALRAYSFAAEAGSELARKNLSTLLIRHGLDEAATHMSQQFAGASGGDQ